jgi:hypothetical protein
MFDQPTVAVGHESVAVVADMVEPDMGDHREVATSAWSRVISVKSTLATLCRTIGWTSALAAKLPGYRAGGPHAVEGVSDGVEVVRAALSED